MDSFNSWAIKEAKQKRLGKSIINLQEFSMLNFRTKDYGMQE